MRLRLLFVAALTLAGGAAALAQVTVHDPAVQTIMAAKTNPGALAFWAGGNDPPDDESKAEAKARWAEAVKGAQALQATGAELQSAERARPGSWKKWAQAMVDAGKEGEVAVKAKDAPKAFDIGAKVYDSCNGCHSTYIPRQPRQMDALPEIPK
jgi:cytochrome c556